MENEVVENEVVVEQPKTKKELRLEKKAYRKTPEYKRSKIDKLLSKQHIKYRGPLSYRSVRIVGYILMVLAQIYLIISVLNKVKTLPEWSLNMADVFEIFSIFSIPLFLMANFCIIMSKQQNIKKFLITYAAIAIGVYLIIIFVYYRYVYGIALSITDTPEAAFEFSEGVAKRFFSKIINYNVFVDLLLFTLFYYFFFYKPEKIKTKKGLLCFRLCSLIPVVLVIVSTILYSLNFKEIIDLPVAVLAILPCRSPAFYVIFFALAALLKLRKYRFMKLGGTEDEYKIYTTSNRSSLEVSVLGAIIISLISIIDFMVLMFAPVMLFYGFGFNFYLIAVVPFIFLLSYTRKPKGKIFDLILPILFIVIVIICYLEGILYFFK